MKVVVSRHIFGSVRGYTTLAKSEDLSHEEVADLEIFSFGQTNESSYMNSLKTDPAYISRALRSGKWAVTRVFQGKPDEHNRTTLLFVSAVIASEDWVNSLKCDVNKLLYYGDLWQWDGKEKLEPIEVAIGGEREAADREIRSRVLCLVAALEKYSSDKNTTIVVRAADFDVEVLRVLNMVLPLKAKQTFSCAARSLNDGLPFSVISMAKEGSLGNSKRRTINWTPTSTADDCVYTESLAGFWPPGAEPPWQFIDRCRSFSVDLEAARVSGLDERIARRKRLRYEIKKPGVRSKRHISWKLGLIFLGCAVLVCTGIAIRATLAKAEEEKEEEKKVAVLVEKARGFLDKNSREGAAKRCFPKNPNARKEEIKGAQDLRYELERWRDRAFEAGLQIEWEAQRNGLVKYLNSAIDADGRYDGLSAGYEQASRLNKKPSVYPKPREVEGVLELEQSVAKVSEAYLDPRYVSDVKKHVQVKTGQWQIAIKKLVYGKTNNVTKLLESDLLKTTPGNYSLKKYEEYEGLKEKLSEFEKDPNLANAKDSPIPEHREKAREAIRETQLLLTVCTEALKKMNQFKKAAEESLQAFNKIISDCHISDPNIANIRVKSLGCFLKANGELDKLRKAWPGMEKLKEAEKELTAKFRSYAENLINKWQSDIDKTAAELREEDPNSKKIRELRRECAGFRKISAEGRIQKIGDAFQRMKHFEEELYKELASISKSKQGESEESKSNGS